MYDDDARGMFSPTKAMTPGRRAFRVRAGRASARKQRLLGFVYMARARQVVERNRTLRREYRIVALALNFARLSDTCKASLAARLDEIASQLPEGRPKLKEAKLRSDKSVYVK